MKRRNFIANFGAGLAGFSIIPNVLIFPGLGESADSFKLLIESAAGQIRHGALNLPQIGGAKFSTPFKWLGGLNRNLFFGKGFQISTNKEDIEIVSIIYKHPETEVEEAIQVQLDQSHLNILIGDHFFENKYTAGLNLITEAVDSDLRIHFGSSTGSGQLSMETNRQSEYFIFNLEKEMQVNGMNTLFENEGLGIKQVSYLDFNVDSNCKFLILEFIGLNKKN